MSNVVATRPERGTPWFSDMRRAFSEARFSDAAMIFDAHAKRAPVEAVLLRSRTYLKLLDNPGAIAMLTSLNPLSEKAHEAERLMLLGAANSRSNRFKESDDFFARAAKSEAHLFFPAELPYLRGRRFLEERDLKRARAELRRVRALNSSDARLLGDLLECGLLSQEERYAETAKLLRNLLMFLETTPQTYIEESIHALRTLASLARELYDPAGWEFVKARAGIQQWTDDFRAHQFQTLKAVGWCCALQGDYFNGFRYLKMAGKIAPTNAWQAMTFLDRAYLARCIGEMQWAQDELSEAEELLRTVRWRETADVERVALILAAELYAPTDSSKAGSFLAEFSELRDSMDSVVLFRYDRRLIALADYAAGVANTYFGNRRAAMANLRAAWEVYDRIQYDWRAGRVALRLYELTKEVRWFECAREKLKNYPRSWLAKELQAGNPEPENLPKLTKAERRMLRMVYEGKSTREICDQTGLSHYTIQNHVNAVLKKFGVPNRAALMAEIIKLGVSNL